MNYPARPLCQYHGHFVKLLNSKYSMIISHTLIAPFICSIFSTNQTISKSSPASTSASSQLPKRCQIRWINGLLQLFKTLDIIPNIFPARTMDLAWWILCLKSNWQCKSNFQNDLDIMQWVHAIKFKLVRSRAVLTENYELLGFRSVAWNLISLNVFFYLFLNSKFYCTPGLRKVLEINILSHWVILINI